MIATLLERPRDARGFAPLPTFFFAVAIVALFVGCPIGLIFALLADQDATRLILAHMSKVALFFYLQGVGSVPAIVFALALLPRLGARSLREFGFRRPTPREVGLGVAAGVGTQILAAVIGALQQLVTHTRSEQDVTKLLAGLHGASAIGPALVAVIVAPFVEELIFRAFVHRALRRYLRVPFAVAIGGLIFGAAHGTPLFFLPLAATGIVLALCYEATGCFWVNYLCHFTVNLLAMIAVFFTR